MGWEFAEKRYRDFDHGDQVRFFGTLGKVYKPGWWSMERDDIYVAVVLEGTDKVQRLHFEALEVEVPEPPAPPAQQFRETEYFVETSTGVLFKRQYEDFTWHFIALGTIRKSIASKDAHPSGFKRLYKEA